MQAKRTAPKLSALEAAVKVLGRARNPSANTPRIAMKHYLQVTDADFDLATQGGAESGAAGARRDSQTVA